MLSNQNIVMFYITAVFHLCLYEAHEVCDFGFELFLLLFGFTFKLQNDKVILWVLFLPLLLVFWCKSHAAGFLVMV